MEKFPYDRSTVFLSFLSSGKNRWDSSDDKYERTKIKFSKKVHIKVAFRLKGIIKLQFFKEKHKYSKIPWVTWEINWWNKYIKFKLIYLTFNNDSKHWS